MLIFEDAEMELRSITGNFAHLSPCRMHVFVMENTRLGLYEHHYSAKRSGPVWTQEETCACCFERREATLDPVSIAITND